MGDFPGAGEILYIRDFLFHTDTARRGNYSPHALYR